MTQKINFTKAALLDLPPAPTGKRMSYQDEKVSGLTLRITDNGVKSFVLYRRINGRPERITLGRFPDMTIEQARNKVNELKGMIANGQNVTTRQQKQDRLSLKVLFDKWLNEYAKVYLKTWQESEAIFNRYFKPLARCWLAEIDRPMVRSWHQKIGDDNGHHTANRALALLSTLFNKAVEWDLWDKNNPCQGVKKFKETARDRFIQPEEMQSLFQALAEEPNTTARDYFLICLFTGARSGNVAAMMWDQVNLTRAEWHIPDTKNGQPQTVGLVPEAVAVLTQRLENRLHPLWVFPAVRGDGHITQAKVAWARVCERAGIEGVRIHDLRRTNASYQAIAGASPFIIGKSLNHKSIASTAIYARLNLDPVRKSQETAVNAMLAAGGLKDKAEVIPLKKVGNDD